ncbi:hypothetical protein GGF50DRAFT_63687 [Schizophyllum commune]
MAAAAQHAPVVTPSLSPLDIDALRALQPLHVIYNSGPIYTGHIPLQPLPGDSPPAIVHQADDTRSPAAPDAVPRQRPAPAAAAFAAPAPPEPPQSTSPAPAVPPPPVLPANPPQNIDPPVQLHRLLYDGSLVWDARHDIDHVRLRHNGDLHYPNLDVETALTPSLRIAYYCCPPGGNPKPFPEHWGPIDINPSSRRTGQGRWTELRGGLLMWQWQPAPHLARLTVGTVLRAIYLYLRVPVAGGRRRIDYLRASLFAGISVMEDGELILRMHQSNDQ